MGPDASLRPVDVTQDQAKANLREQAKRARLDRLEVGGPPGSTEICAGLSAFLTEWFDRPSINSRADGPPWTIAFLAMPSEPNLAELVANPAMDGVTRFATTRTPTDGMDLTIHPMDSDFEPHRYGFDQPIEGSEMVDDRLVGAILVPGLVFDEQGGRLGFGAGYYDRLLERLLQVNDPAQLAIIGISDEYGLADGFAVDQVPMQAHDVPMTHLATTAGVSTVNAN